MSRFLLVEEPEGMFSMKNSTAVLLYSIADIEPKNVLQGLLLCKADHKYKTNNQLFPVLFQDQLKPAGSTTACSIPLILFTKERLLAIPITSVKHS